MLQNIYDSFDKFIFRCPLLPFSGSASVLFKGDLKEMMDTDLMDVFYIASTDFFDIIQADHLQQEENLKTRHTINKYYLIKEKIKANLLDLETTKKFYSANK